MPYPLREGRATANTTATVPARMRAGALPGGRMDGSAPLMHTPGRGETRHG